jgi:hypothetical protein
MSEGLLDGAWKGRRVFILGGGPSLKGFDPSLLAGEVTLGLNWSFLHNPTAALIYDMRLMKVLSTDQAWAGYKGAKYWLNSEDLSLPKNYYSDTRQIHAYPYNPYQPWPKNLSEGIWRGNNAGTAGISFAEVLGASMIYLLGYDMRAEAGRPSNWHDLYPQEWRAKEAQMKDYRDDIKTIRFMLRSKVVNLTPDSALEVFPKDTLEHVLETKEPCQT